MVGVLTLPCPTSAEPQLVEAVLYRLGRRKGVRPALDDGLPDMNRHAHNFVFSVTWDDHERRFKAGHFRELRRLGPPGSLRGAAGRPAATTRLRGGAVGQEVGNRGRRA